MSSLEQQIKELAAKAQAWDQLVGMTQQDGVGSISGQTLRRWIRAKERAIQTAGPPATAVPAEPVHTVLCTMTGMEPGGTPECIGYHCPRCGMPTSSQGHTSRRACSEALSAYNERLYGTPAEEAPWPGKRPARETGP